MGYLIDTQILLWALINPNKLGKQTVQILEGNTIFVSYISLFEIIIKQKIGKLPELAFPIKSLVERIEQDNFNVLPLNINQFEAYDKIPLVLNHRDPFDRLLIAIALAENLPIISADDKFELYTSQIQLIKNR